MTDFFSDLGLLLLFLLDMDIDVVVDVWDCLLLLLLCSLSSVDG